jgi:hypothetical protein
MTGINVIDIRNMITEDVLANILEPYKFTAAEFADDYEGIVLWSDDLHIWASGKSKEDAIKSLATEILEHSNDFYKEFNLWVKDRGVQVPYVLKALMLNDVEKIGGLITCRPGEI